MSSTETDDSKRLAGALFDEVVLPLAKARLSAGKQAYFPTSGQPGAKSYYTEPIRRVLEPAEFEFPGGGMAEGLVDQLVAYWIAQGEHELAAMGPRLKQIAESLKEKVAEGDGSVDIFCYTMF